MKAYLITGITSGIGNHLFNELVKTNLVYGIYRNETKFKQLKVDNKSFLHNIVGLKVDLENPDSISETLSKIDVKFDGLIYCAGNAETRPIKLSDYKFNKSMFNVNYFSLLEIIRVLFLKKLFNMHSSIVAISSVTSQSAEKGKTTYSGSKGALESSVKSIAFEFIQHKIRINLIRSAMVDTEILSDYKELLGDTFLDNITLKQPLGIISKEDIISLIKYLLSDSSVKITGTTINLDAGWLL
jgi:NAD(P)-dependent dehydrogenase (short-subunit alcohol dehydrogenase family)